MYVPDSGNCPHCDRYCGDYLTKHINACWKNPNNKVSGICGYCGKEFNRVLYGKYDKGKYCSKECGLKYSRSKNRKNIICEQCGCEIQVPILRTNLCDDCFKKSKQNIISKKNFLIKKNNKNNTNIIGTIGEFKSILFFLKVGISVYTPVCDNYKIDLIADFFNKLQKIQIKTSTIINNNNITFDLQTSIYKNKKMIHYSYGCDEVDYFILYNLQHDEIYLLKNDKLRTSITINLSNTCLLKTCNKRQDFLIENVLKIK